MLHQSHKKNWIEMFCYHYEIQILITQSLFSVFYIKTLLLIATLWVTLVHLSHVEYRLWNTRLLRIDLISTLLFVWKQRVEVKNVLTN